MHVAEIATRSFDFIALGRTEDEARDSLMFGWQAHCGSNPEVDPNYIDPIDIRVHEIKAGQCLRDGVVISHEPNAEGEAPADIALRVLRAAYDNTESFELGNVGSYMSYLVMAILASTPQVILLDLTEGGRDAGIHELFREIFDEEDVVWKYIEIKE